MKLGVEHLLLRDVPEEERPRERLIQKGAATLSNIELIAILLRTGSAGESVVSLAQRVLNKIGNLPRFTHTTWQELMEVRGIGPAKAVQLMAGIELGRRIARVLPEQRYRILTPADAAQCVMEELRHLAQEHFICLFLNTKNQMTDKKCIFKGSLNSAVVHPREIYSEAIRRNSASIICIHNHPSGDPTPSPEDIEVTKRLVEAGRIVGIELIDHIIIGDQRFYSMLENGILKEFN